jgi:hypothetical protein
VRRALRKVGEPVPQELWRNEEWVEKLLFGPVHEFQASPDHRWALVWFGIAVEAVGMYLTGWLSVVVVWIGAILIMGTLFPQRRTRKA